MYQNSDVVHLLNLPNLKFDHVHWQLDVMWDTDYEQPVQYSKEYVEQARKMAEEKNLE